MSHSLQTDVPRTPVNRQRACRLPLLARLSLGALVLTAPLLSLSVAALFCFVAFQSPPQWSPDPGGVVSLGCFLWVMLMLTFSVRILERPLELTNAIIERLGAGLQARAHDATREQHGSGVVPAQPPIGHGDEPASASLCDTPRRDNDPAGG